MSPRKTATQSRSQFDTLLTEVLAVIAEPVTPTELANVLVSLGQDYETLSRLQDLGIEARLRALEASGAVQSPAPGKYSAAPLSSEALRALFAKPHYARLPAAIAHSLPIVGTRGDGDIGRLKRDLRHAFYSADAAFLNSTIQDIKINLPQELIGGTHFDFLFDEPEEWLLSLPDPFLMVCAWQLVPAAIRELRPIRPLAEKLYTMIEKAKTSALCPLLDYAILCGNWKQVRAIVYQLPSGEAPRLTRIAWLRFITGKDDEAIQFFLEALDSLRQELRHHDGWFSTIGGIFLLLAELRLGTEQSLSAADLQVNAAIAEDTEFRSIYLLLQRVVECKLHPDLPPPQCHWLAGPAIVNIFSCLAQYWLTGELAPAQRLLLDQAAARAQKGGFHWLAEECAEFQHRLDATSQSASRKWHDAEAHAMPFMLDCVLNQNSWLERLSRVERHLAELPDRIQSRLVWFVNIESADRGLFPVRPVEQTFRNGRWTRGRKFINFHEDDFTAINDTGAENAPTPGEFQLTPQDKFACDTLRHAEEYLRRHPDAGRFAWGKVLQALIGHPNVFLDNTDGRPVRCVSAEPRIRLAQIDGQIQYRLLPEPADGENLVVRLESGDLLAVYQFDNDLARLRTLLGADFRIPLESAQENAEILGLLAQHYQMLADFPVEQLPLPVEKADAMPRLRLQPLARGLRIQLLFQPFGSLQEYFLPGEGPVEYIFQEGERIRRIRRDPEAERKCAEELVASCERLAASAPVEPWVWQMEGQACYEFSLQVRELLDRCHVQWPEDQKFICRRTLTLGNVSLHTQSYQSWFSVDGEVQLDDSAATATLADLMQAAVVEKQRFVALSDGQIASISEGLRKRLLELSRLGERGKNGGALQICRFLMPFLGDYLKGFGGIRRTPETEAFIASYNQAMEAKPRPAADIAKVLRPYQSEGFTWLARLDAVHAGACLADDMGLGKTIQAISLFLRCLPEGPGLVVAPTSVCDNWLAEFQRFAPSVHCEIFGRGDRREAFQCLGKNHVLITSYGHLQSELARFQQQHWRIAVLDEAQAIKNSHAKRSQAASEINADFRLVTTGTPVENNLNELWSIFNFIIPGLLGSREGFQRRFATPIEHDNDQEVSQHLKRLISPFLLRRRKDQVLSELPPKEEIDYPVTLSEAERRFYDDLRHKILAELDASTENEGQKEIRVLAGITKLRLAVDHPSLVEGGTGLQGSKLEAFLELLKGLLENGHKILVFSQFTKFLSVVRDALDREKVKYQYLDGSVVARERAAAVAGFQNGEAPVFLISLKAGGLGLNLTQADYVIHLDSWWNPAVENQASDRAHRLGQDKKVTIYHLRAANTIEDKIKALHQRKRDLAETLLANTDDIKTTSLEELLTLIRE